MKNDPSHDVRLKKGVAFTVERAAKQSTVIKATREAHAILDKCRIPRDEASVKVVVDHVAVSAATKGVPVELGD
jgi:hypothetical protein